MKFKINKLIVLLLGSLVSYYASADNTLTITNKTNQDLYYSVQYNHIYCQPELDKYLPAHNTVNKNMQGCLVLAVGAKLENVTKRCIPYETQTLTNQKAIATNEKFKITKLPDGSCEVFKVS